MATYTRQDWQVGKLVPADTWETELTYWRVKSVGRRYITLTRAKLTVQVELTTGKLREDCAPKTFRERVEYPARVWPTKTAYKAHRYHTAVKYVVRSYFQTTGGAAATLEQLLAVAKILKLQLPKAPK